MRRYGLLVAALAGALVAFLPVSTGLMAVGAILLVALVIIEPASTFAFLMVFAPLRTLLNTEAAALAGVDPGQLLLLAVIAIVATHSAIQYRRLRPPRLPLTFLPIFAFFLAITLSVVSTVSVNGWLREWLKWLQVILLAILTLHLSRRTPTIYIVGALAAAGAANAIIGLYQFFGGSGALHLLVNERYFRAFGSFGQPNPFGAFMGILIPLMASVGLAYLIDLWRCWNKQRAVNVQHVMMALFFVFVTGLMTAALVASWSRGAWLGFTASIGIVILSFPARLWQSIALLLTGTVLGTLAWIAGLVPQAISSRLASITADVFSLNDVRGVDITSANYAVVERLAHWQAALRMAEASPATGIGAGNYEIAYESYRLINWVEPLGHAHNFYLNVLAETGIIGLIVYLSCWLAVFYLTWRARQHPNIVMRGIAVGLLGCWTYIAVHSLTDNLYVNNLFMHIGVLMGLLAIVYRDTFSFLRAE